MAGWSQSALARHMCTSQSAVSQIESGKREPSYQMLVRIASALQINGGYLFGVELPSFGEQEGMLFMQYRKLNQNGQRVLLSVAVMLAGMDEMVPVSTALAERP